MKRGENHKLFQNHQVENSKLKLNALGLPFSNINNSEPALISGNHLLIPNSLLKNEESFQNLLSINTISKLTTDEKSYLKRFLPQNMTFEELYKNQNFQKEKDLLIKNIIKGEYFPEVAIQREHVTKLKRKLNQLDTMIDEQIKQTKYQ
eukprot:gene9495-1701_t